MPRPMASLQGETLAIGGGPDGDALEEEVGRPPQQRHQHRCGQHEHAEDDEEGKQPQRRSGLAALVAQGGEHADSVRRVVARRTGP